MDKYIDSDLAIKDIQETYCKPCKKRGDDYHGVMCRACWVGDCISIIDDCEEADVQPLVHAHWIIINQHEQNRLIRIHKCSRCNCFSRKNYRFCPNCGSRMDGDEHDSD